MKNTFRKITVRLILIFFSFWGFTSIGQVAITNDGTPPDSSAMLHVKSPDKGFLTPRMTSTKRIAIIKPANGLLVYDSTTNSVWVYKGLLGWKEMPPSRWLSHANGIYYSENSVAIGGLPQQYVALTISGVNINGAGNAILHLRSEDTWHSAISIFNGPIESAKSFSFILSGPSNTNSPPGTFGLFNHQSLNWSFNFSPLTNNMAIGSTSFNANTPKSKLHVFNGDINVDQIGSGIIMKSPNGNCWRITIDNTGNLVRTAITCP